MRSKSILALTLATSLTAAAMLTGQASGADRNASSPGEAAVSCKPVATAAQLNAIRNNLAGNYCLTADIDAGTIANFVPIGTANEPFTGKLFGNDHVISNLTIRSRALYVGLFGATTGATIQDLGLINVNVTATGVAYMAGGLAGLVYAAGDATATAAVTRVFTTGQVSCTDVNCYAAGIIGELWNNGDTATLSDSWSSANVSGGYAGGGAVGLAGISSVTRTYATGAVSCTRSAGCTAGGLIGSMSGTAVTRSFATGAVAGIGPGYAGGLIGFAGRQNADAPSTVQQSFATGPVICSGAVGGLIGRLSDSAASEVYAAGRVSGGGAELGGLVGGTFGVPKVVNAYWDTTTTGQMASAGGGAGLTTTQLRAALPAGFSNAWAITKGLSYPFLNDADIGLASPLATLVRVNPIATFNLIYTFLPIGQRDLSQYRGKPAHTDEASLATVYTMIARAIGAARDVPLLKGVTINTYFWRDRTRTAAWDGPVTGYASLGRLVSAAGSAPITAAVIGQLNAQRLVILRGTYTKRDGGTATHWMLATLYIRNPGNAPATVVAHDPWTGTQVAIDPTTKKVIAPADFPLSSFKVDGYQAVVIN